VENLKRPAKPAFYEPLIHFEKSTSGEGGITSAARSAAMVIPGRGPAPPSDSAALRASFFVPSRFGEQVRHAVGNKKRCRLCRQRCRCDLRRGWDENLLLISLMINYLLAGVKRGYGLLLGERV